MELFTTKISLKNDATFDAVWNIIKTWLIKSPHYQISSIDYNGESLYSRKYGSNEIKIIKCDISSDKVFALKFINPDKSNIWEIDCIFVETPEEKRISVALSCNTSGYKSNLPRIHKPHIIKKIIESGLCRTDGALAICDTPIYLKETDIALCTKIMRGEIKTPLPVVYLSLDDFNPNKYSADEKSLAIKLSGIAHVLVEPSKAFSKRLKISTDSHNPYHGYVGIYFPETSYKEIISFDDCYIKGVLDRTKASDTIRETVQQALLNHDKAIDYSWNSIQIAYHRKNYESASRTAADAKKECDEFITAFDEDIRKKDEKIADLQRQLDAKNAIIESFKAKTSAQSSITFNISNIREFYNGELNDLILHLLSATYKKSKDCMTTRQRELLELFLKGNSEVGVGKIILKDIEKALKEKSLVSRRSMLESCGFTVNKGAHDKIYFHDPKYSFTLANSPSEHRGDENMLSDIKKEIDIYKKI